MVLHLISPKIQNTSDLAFQTYVDLAQGILLLIMLFIHRQVISLPHRVNLVELQVKHQATVVEKLVDITTIDIIIIIAIVAI